MNGEWHMPEMDVVSAYVDQRGREPIHGGQSSVDDLSAERECSDSFEAFLQFGTVVCCRQGLRSLASRSSTRSRRRCAAAATRWLSTQC